MSSWPQRWTFYSVDRWILVSFFFLFFSFDPRTTETGSLDFDSVQIFIGKSCFLCMKQLVICYTLVIYIFHILMYQFFVKIKVCSNIHYYHLKVILAGVTQKLGLL